MLRIFKKRDVMSEFAKLENQIIISQDKITQQIKFKTRCLKIFEGLKAKFNKIKKEFEELNYEIKTIKVDSTNCTRGR